MAAAISAALLLVAAAFPGATSAARGPRNDAFAKATPIDERPFLEAGAALGRATREKKEARATCAGMTATLWYRFVPGEDGQLSASVRPSAGAAAGAGGETVPTVVLAAWDGSERTDLRQLGCAVGGAAAEGTATAADTAARLSVPVSAGRTYHLQVGAEAPARSFTVDLVVQAPQAISIVMPPAAALGAPPLELAASADSGLPVTYAAAGACAVDGATLTLVSAGTCTVTASQAGDDRWTPAADAVIAFDVSGYPQTITLEAPSEVGHDPRPISLQASASSGLPVVIALEGGCQQIGALVYFGGSDTCTVTATQPGDAQWAPAEPVVHVITIARRPQAITLPPPPAMTVGAPPLMLAATAESGLPVTYTATGACAVDGATLTVLGPGTCTLTASQAGDAAWAPAADVSVSFEVSDAVSGSVDLTGQVATAVPGTLVAPGAQVTSLLDVSRRPEEHYTVGLALGQMLRVTVDAGGREVAVSMAYPDALTTGAPEDIEWFEMPADGWLASEDGTWSVRIADAGGGAGAYRYTATFEVEGGG